MTHLSKDVWFHIAHFLNKNDIACLKATCTIINTWLANHPRLVVDKIKYSFWNSLVEELIDDNGGSYGTDDYCVFIEGIDRGVNDFTTFAKRLKAAYPNIKELDFEQNYSYTGEDSYNWEKDFLFFLRYMGLTYLKIEDSQSR